MGWWPFLISGLFVVVGIPLAMKMVPQNGWYGVRTTETMSNKEIWYRANAFMGKGTVASGILSLLILLALDRFWTGAPLIERVVGLIVPLGVFAVANAVMLFLKRSF